MRVLLLSRYGRLGASSRLRSYQYIPFLKGNGIDVTIAPLFGDDYINEMYTGKVSALGVLQSYVARIRSMLISSKYDLVWTEKEMLPWFPSWIELGLFPANTPLIVDYDDAIFHRYDQHGLSFVRRVLGQKIDDVMCRANLVIVGNEYLAARARLAGAKKIEILPTVVDISRYKVIEKTLDKPLTIGWIGSPNTARYLKFIMPVLRELVINYSIKMVVLGANTGQFLEEKVEVRPWSEQDEVKDLQQFDIGIMPLPDKSFERGKCGYKLIQYMACGLPVIASPVGVNNVIVEHGVNGFLASKKDEWKTFLMELILNSKLRIKMGTSGRAKIIRQYSLQVAEPQLRDLLISEGRKNEPR